MSWVAVGGAVIGAGSSFLNNKSNKKANDQNNQMNLADTQAGRDWQDKNDLRDRGYATEQQALDNAQIKSNAEWQAGQNRVNQGGSFGSTSWGKDANGNPTFNSSLDPSTQNSLNQLRSGYGNAIGSLGGGGMGGNNNGQQYNQNGSQIPGNQGGASSQGAGSQGGTNAGGGSQGSTYGNANGGFQGGANNPTFDTQRRYSDFNAGVNTGQFGGNANTGQFGGNANTGQFNGNANTGQFNGNANNGQYKGSVGDSGRGSFNQQANNGAFGGQAEGGRFAGAASDSSFDTTLNSGDYGTNNAVLAAMRAQAAPAMQQQRDAENARLAATGLSTGSGQA